MPVLLLLALVAPPPVVVPLRQAHAHNDYAHTRPLHDALAHGFTSVEADIFLARNKLLVGHTSFELRPERTLETLYLEPLRQRVQANKGKVYLDGPTFHLLIDIKTDADRTYAVLAPLLRRYADILTVADHGKVTPGAVTVVLSGNCPRAALLRDKVRYAAIDGRPGDLQSEASADLIPWISTSWSSQFRWRGVGPMPEKERAKLQEFVAQAHRRGRLVRFWATPENRAVWRELRKAGVDLFNTDRLAELRDFLRTE